MESHFTLQYRSLRDDFRNFQQGGCIDVDSEMSPRAFTSNVPASPGQELSTRNGSSSSSSFRNTPNSSDESLTVVRSETKASNSYSHDCNGSSLESRTPPEEEEEEEASIEAKQRPDLNGLPSHRPRKGHKKSRGGCYNCKRRKIKVRSQLHHVIDIVDIDSSLVSGESTCVLQLQSEEFAMQIPCSQNAFGFTRLCLIFSKPDCVHQSAEHADDLHANRYATFPSLPLECISTFTGRQ